jgi:hypothetical protein
MAQRSWVVRLRSAQKALAGALGGLAVLALQALAAQAEQRVLRFHHFLPERSPQHQDIYLPWAKRVRWRRTSMFGSPSSTASPTCRSWRMAGGNRRSQNRAGRKIRSLELPARYQRASVGPNADRIR